jgi:hypothetical protein
VSRSTGPEKGAHVVAMTIIRPWSSYAETRTPVALVHFFHLN